MKRRVLPPLFFSVWLPTRLALLWHKRVRPPRLRQERRRTPRSIILFRLDALGDVVLTTPLFRALKSAHPRSRLTVVVQRSYKALLATNPHIDEILTLPMVRPHWLPQGLRRLLAAVIFYWTELRRRRFDLAILPRWDVDEHLATLLCILTNAVRKVGYGSAATPAKCAANRGFDAAFDISLSPGGRTRHEVLRSLAVAEALGATACDTRPQIVVTEQDRKRASRLLTKVPEAAKLVALGIGAASPGRRWPLRRYAQVVTQLEQQNYMRAVIVCSAVELGEALKLARLLKRPPVIVSGERLRNVCALLERCELFVGNDSGCAHLAAAMSCATLVISRHPRNGDRNHFNSPVRFAPLGARVQVLQPLTGTGDCKGACRSLAPHCIRAVSVDEVVAAAQRLLSEPGREKAARTAPARASIAQFAEQDLLPAHAAGVLHAGTLAMHTIRRQLSARAPNI